MGSFYLGLGSNLGARGRTIRDALRALARTEGVTLLAVSPFYETEPWGVTDQPAFLNGAVLVDTVLSAEDLLTVCQRIETALGRDRSENAVHWGPRTIDIDILYAPGILRQTPPILPHPYIKERAFVLMPLRDIAPKLIIDREPIGSLLEKLPMDGIRRSKEYSDPFPFSAIACVDKAGGLGKDGRLLRHVREDMRRFFRLTLGGIVVMGRRTMESLPEEKPLVGRRNIVLSKTADPALCEGFTVCRDLSELSFVLGKMAVEAAEKGERDLPKVWCIGGASVYEALLPYTSEVYLTELSESYDADTFLPPLDDFEPIATKKMDEGLYRYLIRKESASLGDLS